MSIANEATARRRVCRATHHPRAPHPDRGQQALHRGGGPRPLPVVLRERRLEDRPARSQRLQLQGVRRCRRRTPRRSASSRGRTAHSGSPRRPATRSAASRREGQVTEFPLPTPNAGPDAMMLGTRRQPVVLADRGEPDRPHHPRRQDHLVQGRHHAGLEAALHRRARRRDVVQRGRRRPHRPPDGGRQDHRVSDPEQGQPAAGDVHPSRTARSGSCRPRRTDCAGSTATAA